MCRRMVYGSEYLLVAGRILFALSSFFLFPFLVFIPSLCSEDLLNDCLEIEIFLDPGN